MMPEAKQEGDNNDSMLPTSYTSSSRQWAGFKNPRIVRVSKAFGGKDRHSKVCTVKGLRDRRIRLSVPTAIQLYDLQDRLGVNQPSKVIDWLLDSTKNDIDQLPPLQMLPQDYTQFHPLPPSLNIQQDLNSPQVSFTQFLNTPNATFVKDVGNRTLLYTKQDINGDHQRKKGKETVVENEGLNFFPYNPNYYNWEPSSNLSLSQFGNQTLVSSETDNSSMTSSSASQFSFTPYHMPNLGENHDVFRQNNHFHMLSSSTSQNVPSNAPRPILFNQLISDSQEKVPFGLDQSPKTDNR